MEDKIKKIFKHPLIAGSSTIFIGSLIANVFNFLFNIYMSRNLSVVDYGTLASLVSIILLCALAAESFVPTIVKFGGAFFAKQENNKIKGLFYLVNKLAAFFGISLFLLFFIFSNKISTFFNIKSTYLIVFTGVIVFCGFMSAVNRAILQAKLAFKYIAIIGILSSILKLSLGIVLVYLGYKVNGAMWGFFLSFSAPYIFFLLSLRSYFVKEIISEHPVSVQKLFSYGGPSALALLGLTFFITTDIILVKHFYQAKQAGVYAGLSLIGRVIFFFSLPIGTVMFPLIVQKHTKQENYKGIFKLAICLVLFFSLMLTLFYFLFPEFSIRLFLKKDEYLILKSYLVPFGIFITLYSISSVMTNFFLSIHQTKVFIPILITASFQAVLIWFYHETFSQIIQISILSVSLLLISLLLYYWRLKGVIIDNNNEFLLKENMFKS